MLQYYCINKGGNIMYNAKKLAQAIYDEVVKQCYKKNKKGKK